MTSGARPVARCGELAKRTASPGLVTPRAAMRACIEHHVEVDPFGQR